MAALDLPAESYPVLAAFGGYLLGVAALGIASHRFLARGSFVKEYFIGNRGLGPWVLALTVAATAISGGTFMGFPSLIYSNGWVMALWIASYMVVPLTTMALLGKRINQAARVSGAVTVPDVLRDRFRSPTLGVVSTLMILLFLSFNLVAQFKAGGLVMKEALRLRPPPAELLDVTPDAPTRTVALRFQAPGGRVESLKVPLPDERAELLADRTRVNEAAREVEVFFRAGDRESHKLVRFPPSLVRVPVLGWRVEQGYLIGLMLFAFTVVAYTTYGGFWAVTWTDVLEGLVMLVGVVTMAVLAVRAVPELTTDAGTLAGLPAATEHLRRQDPALVQGPGPGNFLPLGMAFSFFLMWSLTSAGQPSGMVRLMSFKDTPSLRRALLLVCGYYVLTYLSLLVIFVCARAVFPTEYLREFGSEGEPDSIMPAMTRKVAPPLFAGMLLAAPYAAIMSTVAAFLLMISSSLVRDIYQRSINPGVSGRTMRALSYTATAVVGLGVMVAALRPPAFLQYIIVFTGSGQGCSFLIPMGLSLYWKRTTRQGALAGLIGGFLGVVGLYVLGWLDGADLAAVEAALGWLPGWGATRPDGFAPLYAGGVDPLVWGFVASLTLTVGVSLATTPDEEQAKKYFP